MADYDRVLERLVVDPEFLDRVRRDPHEALIGYELSSDDLDVLRATIEQDPGSLREVEERQNKATLMGMAAGIVDAVQTSGRPNAADTVEAMTRRDHAEPTIARFGAKDLVGGGNGGAADAVFAATPDAGSSDAALRARMASMQDALSGLVDQANEMNTGMTDAIPDESAP